MLKGCRESTGPKGFRFYACDRASGSAAIYKFIDLRGLESKWLWELFHGHFRNIKKLVIS